MARYESRARSPGRQSRVAARARPAVPRGLAPPLQRPRPGPRRRDGAEHPGDDRGPRPTRGTPVTIVTPTPSRLGDDAAPGRRRRCSGPETDLEAVVRCGRGRPHARALAGPHPARGAGGPRGRRPLPDRGARHGRALGPAAQGAGRRRSTPALVEGEEPAPGRLPARPVAPRDRPPPGARARDAGLLRPQRRRPRARSTTCPPASALEAEFPELAGKFVLLFFGRLHVKKGLDLLAEALAALAREHPDLHLLLAGKDDGALGAVPPTGSTTPGWPSRVTWVGHVAGERARQVWGAADAFILPSYSEGFSMAILEALACRLPCLITTACHFPELGRGRGRASSSSRPPTA